jgi:nucleoside-diphosphate-sugar epimerase
VPIAFVTGATGFVGVNLVEELLAREWRVIALHRESSNLRLLERLPCERAVGEITDTDSLRRAIPDGADVVFHVAGDTNMWSRHNDRQTRNNVDGTRNMVEVALEKRVGRFVHTSSIAAYGIHDGVVDEDTEPTAADSWIHYLRTKALAEREVREGLARGLDAVVVNPANILGRYDLRNWSTMFWLVASGKLTVAPPGGGSFCEAREVARAHVEAAARGRTGAHYLLGGADASYLEMIALVGDVLGRPVPRKPTSATALAIAARLAVAVSAFTGKTPLLTPEKAALVSASMRCSSERAMRELDYRPVALRTMIETCCSWMRAAGRLPGAAR